MMSLIEKAMSISSSSKSNSISEDEIELFVALLEGRVSQKQVIHALGIGDHRGSFYTWAYKLTRQCVTRRNLVIQKKGGE